MTPELPHQPHQCPRCELRFAWRTELADHMAVEHPTRPEVIEPEPRRPLSRR